MNDLYERTTDCAKCGEGCREIVFAVNVSDQRGPDGYGFAGEYQHVDTSTLEAGDEWTGEQCGSCGGSDYVVGHISGHFRIKCAGCGVVYPVVTMQSHNVVF